jgi:multiple sugar transport system ATP-binding protein
MAAIDIEKLDKTYDNGYRAVKAIDLAIRDREFMVLVGPSGCGKTTTLRMIAGLEDITGGEIRIGGSRVNEVAPKDRDIAMVFQSYALYPHMTVYENMAFALRLRKMPAEDIHRTVTQAADMLGLAPQLGKLPKQLSGGQRQRVALGRAIVRKPKAFLFDEPLSNLDAKLRGEMRYELRRLQTALATTSVYVTHDQVEAMTLGDRITVMSVGEVQQVAPPTALYRYPWNRFVAGFIGTPPMNILPGRLAGGEGAWRLEAASGISLELRMPHAARLAGRSGAEVAVGLRPEHLHAPSFGPPGLPTLSLRVEVVEHMGDHQYIYLASGIPGNSLIMKAPSQVEPRVGELMTVACDTTQAHVFADLTEHAPNLTLPPEVRQVQ